MELSSDLKTRICLVWNTERPTRAIPRKSSDFLLLGCYWNLQLRTYFNRAGRNHFEISLHQSFETEAMEMNLRVTTFIEDNIHYKFPTVGCSKKVQTESQVICEFDDAKISNKIKNFNFYSKWRIICLFHGISAGYKTRDGTVLLVAPSELDSSASDVEDDVAPGLEALSIDLVNLLKEETFSDVKLRCGGSTISVHRSILAARSEVFAAMFRNKMVESETGFVDISDMDAPILDLLLKYLYSGKTDDLSDDTASRLYVASDKYAIHSLKNTCSDWIVRNMTEENCIESLLLADAHADVAFRHAAISFICCHQAVLRSEIWLKFSEEPSKLAIEVYQSFVESMNM